jgi:hypothetical protein
MSKSRWSSRLQPASETIGDGIQKPAQVTLIILHKVEARNDAEKVDQSTTTGFGFHN